MKKIIWLMCCLTALNSSVIIAKSNVGNTYGYIEKVMLLPDHISFDAKLDTGAATSSLNVRKIKIFKRHGEQWVAFDIYNNDSLVKHATYRLLKIISIKKRTSEIQSTKVDKRPLIEMQFCLGDEVSYIKVNLVDRQNFAYPFLLGREAMHKFNVTINPAKKYLNPLKCPAGNL
ncbi:MAG: ATP-dependent zinc protease [Pseudomonadota bacterium]